MAPTLPAREPLPSGPPPTGDAPVAGSAGPPRSHPRPVTRRGLWISLALVGLGIAAVEAFFRGTGISQGLAQESQYLGKAATFRGAQVVVTGDSRLLHGFDPAAAAEALRAAGLGELSVYNAALPGAPPMAQLAFALRALEQPLRPKLFVIGISPYMFSSRIDRTLSRESLHTLWRARELPTLLRAGGGPEELSIVLAASAFDTYRFRPRIVEMILERKKLQGRADLGQQGFIAYPPVAPAVQDQRAQQRAPLYQDELWHHAGARFGNEQVGYFLELLRLLREEQIPTLVVSTPHAPQLDALYGPQSLYPEHLEWVQQRTREAGATFVDARAFHLPAHRFIDADHLDRDGARAFSTRLAAEFLAPALR